jgi:hypothetical protein
MQPLFTGNARQTRRMDLSGSSSAATDVKQARLARETQRSQAQAALRIQRTWRSYHARGQTKAGWAAQVDARGFTGGDLLETTAILLCSFQGQASELKRFGAFARFVIVEKMLFVPFQMPTSSERWSALMRRMAGYLLQLARAYPE